MLYNARMDKFAALADRTRRRIIELLAERGELPAKEISDQFEVTPQAISQHLKALREAGLVQVEGRAQQRIYRLVPEAFQEVEVWTWELRRMWNERFDAFDSVLQAEKQKGVKDEQE